MSFRIKINRREGKMNFRRKLAMVVPVLAMAVLMPSVARCR